MYAPVAPGPAPKFIVIPKFVEIVAKSFAFTFLRIKVVGKIASTAVVIIKNRTADFLVLSAKAQIVRKMKADNTNLGCTNAESENSPAAEIDLQVKILLSLFKYSSIKRAMAKIKIEAEIDSYPIVRVLRERVGLKAKMKAIGNANLRNLVAEICLAKYQLATA